MVTAEVHGPRCIFRCPHKELRTFKGQRKQEGEVGAYYRSSSVFSLIMSLIKN